MLPPALRRTQPPMIVHGFPPARECVSTHAKMYLNHQVVNSLEMEAWLPCFLITRGCLLLVIASSRFWQRKISWCRLAMSSTAHVDCRRFFVSSGTSIRASIRAHGPRLSLSYPKDQHPSVILHLHS